MYFEIHRVKHAGIQADRQTDRQAARQGVQFHTLRDRIA